MAAACRWTDSSVVLRLAAASEAAIFGVLKLFSVDLNFPTLLGPKEDAVVLCSSEMFSQKSWLTLSVCDPSRYVFQAALPLND